MIELGDDGNVSASAAYFEERGRLKAAMEALATAAVKLNACTVGQELHGLLILARAELQKNMDIKKALYEASFESKGCEF